MARKKGRKIYTYRARNKRIFSKNHTMRSALGIVLTVLIAAVLGVVGYSVAGPVVARLTAEAEHPTQTDNPYFSSEAESSAEQSSSAAEKATETTALTTTLTAKTTDSAAQTTTETELTTTTEATVPEVTPRFEGVTLGYAVSPATAADLKLLETAAKHCAEQGYTAMVLPAKRSGGALTYASGVSDAQKCGASAEAPVLRELIGTVTAQGLSVIAEMNLLEDNLFPKAFSDGSYQIKDNRGRWLDRAESDGGKPWISPFTDHAKRYLAALAGELDDAGCAEVLCTGLTFPRFRSSDEALLGKQVNNSEKRADALISVMEAVNEKTVAVYTCSLADAVNGKAEGLLPERLGKAAVCIRIDFSELEGSFTAGGKRYSLQGKKPGEQAKLAVEAAQKLAGDCELIPCFVRSSVAEDALDAVLEAAHAAGCKQILVTD